MPAQRQRFAPLADIPQLDRFIRAGRRQESAVWMKRHAVDGLEMPAQFGDLAPGGD